LTILARRDGKYFASTQLVLVYHIIASASITDYLSTTDRRHVLLITFENAHTGIFRLRSIESIIDRWQTLETVNTIVHQLKSMDIYVLIVLTSIYNSPPMTLVMRRHQPRRNANGKRTEIIDHTHVMNIVAKYLLNRIVEMSTNSITDDRLNNLQLYHTNG
jgi:hypothetical protein